MDERNIRGLLAIRGKVVLHGEQPLFSKQDVAVRIFSDCLKRVGLEDVKQSGRNSITFQGEMSGESVVHRPLVHDYKIAQIVNRGLVRVSFAGPDLVAHYFIKLDVSTMLTLISRLAFPGFFILFILWEFFSIFYPGFHPLVMLLSLCLLFVAGIMAFTPHHVIQKELESALEYTHKILNFKKEQPDISQAATHLHTQNPEELLRIALYHRYKGEKGRGMHYLALLVKEFPGTREAEIAFEELKSREPNGARA